MLQPAIDAPFVEQMATNQLSFGALVVNRDQAYRAVSRMVWKYILLLKFVCRANKTLAALRIRSVVTAFPALRGGGIGGYRTRPSEGFLLPLIPVVVVSIVYPYEGNNSEGQRRCKGKHSLQHHSGHFLSITRFDSFGTMRNRNYPGWCAKNYFRQNKTKKSSVCSECSPMHEWKYYFMRFCA